jgi:hypothetical protein
MWRGWLAGVIMLAGCVTPLPPTPQDLQAKRFETLPDRASRRVGTAMIALTPGARPLFPAARNKIVTGPAARAAMAVYTDIAFVDRRIP